MNNKRREILVYAHWDGMDHPIILTGRGWILCPAYDINPVETGTGLTINYFRLSEKKATQIIHQINTSVQKWRKIAENIGIFRSEQELMARAFHHSE